MLTQQEKDFIRYWEKNRLRQKKLVRQFLVGIPVGLAIAVPIAINFSTDWFRRAKMEANNPGFNPLVLLVALLFIVVFVAIFYRQHKWDQYEQRYQELLIRLKDDQPESEKLGGPADEMPQERGGVLPGGQNSGRN
jgi:hypothetical protein